MQKQTLPSSFNSLRYFGAGMLLEDNGLLPFLAVWRSFANPKIQSNTVFVVCPNIYIFFYLYALLIQDISEFLANLPSLRISLKLFLGTVSEYKQMFFFADTLQKV